MDIEFSAQTKWNPIQPQNYNILTNSNFVRMGLKSWLSTTSPAPQYQFSVVQSASYNSELNKVVETGFGAVRKDNRLGTADTLFHRSFLGGRMIDRVDLRCVSFQNCCSKIVFCLK